MENRSKDWFRQAKEESLWAQDGLKNGRWAMVCFTAQQVAEKAFKAIAIHRGAAQVKTHSVKDLATELGINGEFERMARILDQYYITTRNPDSFYSGAPFEHFTEGQAVEALGFAKLFLERAEVEVNA